MISSDLQDLDLCPCPRYSISPLTSGSVDRTSLTCNHLRPRQLDKSVLTTAKCRRGKKLEPQQPQELPIGSEVSFGGAQLHLWLQGDSYICLELPSFSLSEQSV